MEIKENVPLKKYSTMGVGGTAKYFLEVTTTEELQQIVKESEASGLYYMVLGKGSNTLFDDRGFDGLVVLNKIDFFEEMSPGVFHVGAGYSFSRLGAQTARKGWSGLEFASGIPGSVGGAVFMNAGANGKEICETIVSVDYIDKTGSLQVLSKEEIVFRYRYSSFHEKKGAIVGATFLLSPSSEARKKQVEIVDYRIKTQPYGEKSSGCIFRNPESGSAGFLIEKSGLKGSNIGGAEVSPMHANFIVNKEGASTQDIVKLISLIKKQVKIKMNIDLQDEVRVIPFSKEEKS